MSDIESLLSWKKVEGSKWKVAGSRWQVLFYVPLSTFNLLPTCNTRHNHQPIFLLQRRIRAFEMADVFIIQKNIDEGAQLTGLGIEVLLEIRVLLNQVAQRRAYGCAGDG